MPPDEPPIAYTRPGSPLYLASAYFTICATACVSPPPSCVSDFVDPTSQQFCPGLSGRIMMKPFASAAFWLNGMLPICPDAVDPHECDDTMIGGFAASLSGM